MVGGGVSLTTYLTNDPLNSGEAHLEEDKTSESEYLA